MNEKNEMITITKQEYEKLLKDSYWLNALETAGVDNWEGYGVAKDYLKEWNNEDGEDNG